MKTTHVLTRLLVALWFGAGWVQVPALAQLPLWPSLEQILQGEPPITTSLNDAVTEVPFLDGFNPSGFVGISALPKGPQQGFVLRPGLFAFEAHSYCMNAGAYAPSKGDGYLYAPLKGSRAGVIASLLHRSVAHPEIAQRDVQALIWAILSRTRLSDMPPRMLAVATQLLTPQEMFEVNGGALGLIPEGLWRQMMARLPQPIQQMLEAEARLRSLLTQVNTTFEQLEQAAVRFGLAPRGEGSREVPEGRWSYHPDGYFIRYFPQGYSRTRTEVYVPETFDVQRDALGRIVSIADAMGNRIETAYDEGILPLVIANEPGVRGYAFSSIRMVRIQPIPPEMVLTLEATWQSQGWTLQGQPTGTGSVGSPPGRYTDAAERYRWAVEHLRQVGRLDQVFKVQGEARAVVDLGLYTQALSKALEGQPKAPAWAKEHLGLAYRAWQAALCQREGGCLGTPGMASAHGPLVQWVSTRLASLFQTANKELDGGVAAPGNTARQRLAQSNQGNDKKDVCQTVKDELLLEQIVLNAYKNPDLLKYATDRNFDDREYNEGVKNYVSRVLDEAQTPSFLTPEDVAAMFTSQRTEKSFGPAMGFDPDTGSIYFNQGKRGETDWVQIIDMERRRTDDYNKAYESYISEYGGDAGEILFKAHVEHEIVHQNNRWRYPVGFPEKLSQNEIEAYQKSIEIKQEGLRKLGCP
ncbi:hypothetical protein [Meiothermus sp.]|uniref:hypothetical protein n=1 Tax=Meiothermus sp. TaxID=1955249 RepID=UPI00307D5E0F